MFVGYMRGAGDGRGSIFRAAGWVPNRKEEEGRKQGIVKASSFPVVVWHDAALDMEKRMEAFERGG